jgi:hypothetical protein
MSQSWLANVSEGHVWEDPTVFSVNKKAPRVPLHAFAKKQDGVDYVRAIGRTRTTQSPGSRTSLTGMWRFKLFNRPEDVPQPFCQPDYVGDAWSEVIYSPRHAYAVPPSESREGHVP